MGLGERVKLRRESLKMKQDQLARAIGVTSQYISAIEQNKRDPSLSSLVKLARELGVTIGYLVSGEEEKVSDIVPAVKADTTLSLEARNALIALVRELRRFGEK